MKTSVALAACAVVLTVVLTGCKKEQQPGGQAPPSLTQGTGSAQPTPTSAAGATWTVPSRWSMGEPRQMRVATYLIPAAGKDAEGAECAVFYFGGGQGGDVQANINRWVGQFENAGKPEQSEKTVAGMSVTLVTVNGTYTSPGGPMMQSQGKKPGYRLLGAIVRAPEGSVFFKMTGPAATVQAAGKEFEELIDSVQKM